MYVNRGFNRIKPEVANGEIYSYYKNNYDAKVTRAIYFKIIKEYNQRIVDEMIFNNFDFKLPFGMGNFSIRKRKMSCLRDPKTGLPYRETMNVDWKETHELWKEIYSDKTFRDIISMPTKKYIYHLNDHSMGYLYKFVWRKWDACFKNQSVYKFNLCKTNKTKVAKSVKEYGKQLNHFLV